MEYNEESKDQDMNEEDSGMETNQWFRDNLRIIISVLIVVVIAGGIYSYSKRAEAPVSLDNSDQNNVLQKIAGTEDSKDQSPAAVEQGNTNTNATAPTANQDQTKKETTKPTSNTSSIATSQETENSFVETAARGDGSTKLARRALANYLEKNPDSTLTAEHKIYIEDYMRKKTAAKKVSIGTSVEFQKTLIQEAISKSKNLNERQLQNLHKYAVRVPSLS